MRKKKMDRKALVLLLVSLPLYINLTVKKKEALEYKKNLKRLQRLYATANKWLRLELCKKDFSKILEKRGYKTVVIYGMGELGQRLLEKLELCNSIHVLYGIDQNADQISAIIPVYQLEKALQLNAPDVVILTMYSKDDSLTDKLQKTFMCPIWNLEELLNEAE